MSRFKNSYFLLFILEDLACLVSLLSLEICFFFPFQVLWVDNISCPLNCLLIPTILNLRLIYSYIKKLESEHFLFCIFNFTSKSYRFRVIFPNLYYICKITFANLHNHILSEYERSELLYCPIHQKIWVEWSHYAIVIRD